MNTLKKSVPVLSLPRVYVTLNVPKADLSVLFDILQTHRLKSKEASEADSIQAISNLLYVTSDYLGLPESEKDNMIALKVHIYELDYLRTALLVNRGSADTEEMTEVKVKLLRRITPLWAKYQESISDFYLNTTIRNRVKLLRKAYWFWYKDVI